MSRRDSRQRIAGRPGFVFLSLIALASCTTDDREGTRGSASDTTRRDSAAGSTESTRAQRVGTVEGFKTPESVRYDAAADVFFVANINGDPGAKDNNGFISRVRADGAVDSLMFIAGGRNGVTLNAPKGMEIAGDTLWVTDIDVVRGFNRITGRPTRSVSLRSQGAIFLNDIASGPDSALYITDTAIGFEGGKITHPGTDRIFKVKGTTVSEAARGDTMARPNGIAWDRANNRFVLVGFGGPRIMTWKPGEATPALLATGPGQFDGVVVLGDGRILISSWADSSIYVVDGTTATRMITGVEGPADIGLDTQRNRLAIPLFNANRVELWSIPARTQ